MLEYIDMINDAKINNHDTSEVIKISSHIFRIMIYVCENCQYCLRWTFDLAFWALFCFADNLCFRILLIIFRNEEICFGLISIFVFFLSFKSRLVFGLQKSLVAILDRVTFFESKLFMIKNMHKRTELIFCWLFLY